MAENIFVSIRVPGLPARARPPTGTLAGVRARAWGGAAVVGGNPGGGAQEKGALRPSPEGSAAGTGRPEGQAPLRGQGRWASGTLEI